MWSLDTSFSMKVILSLLVDMSVAEVFICKIYFEFPIKVYQLLCAISPIWRYLREFSELMVFQASCF
jgi:hypothetical protein